MKYPTRRPMRASGFEFHFIGGGRPYLRMGNPHAPAGEGYIGAIDNVAAIRRLRDYLTLCLGGQTT